MDDMLDLQHQLASLYRRLAQVVCDVNEITCNEPGRGGIPQLMELELLRANLEGRAAQVRAQITAGWGEISAIKPTVHSVYPPD